MHVDSELSRPMYPQLVTVKKACVNRADLYLPAIRDKCSSLSKLETSKNRLSSCYLSWCMVRCDRPGRGVEVFQTNMCVVTRERQVT